MTIFIRFAMAESVVDIDGISGGSRGGGGGGGGVGGVATPPFRPVMNNINIH